MAEREVLPRFDHDFMKRMQDGVENKEIFHPSMLSRIVGALTAFEFEYSEATDVAKHIIDADIEQSLEDSIPMFSWFSMCANKAGERESYFEDKLKTLQMTAVKKKEAVTQQKGGARETTLYLRTHDAWRRYGMIRRNCKALAEAMKMRFDKARTKNVNARVGLTNPWDTRKDQ